MEEELQQPKAVKFYTKIITRIEKSLPASKKKEQRSKRTLTSAACEFMGISPEECTNSPEDSDSPV